MPVPSPSTSPPVNVSNKVAQSNPGTPSGRVISQVLNDFEGFANVFARWNGRFQQMSRGSFQGAIRVVSGQRVRLFQAETNQSILTQGMDNASLATFIPITPRNEGTVWQGKRLSAGQLIVKSPDAEYHNRTAHDTVLRALLVPVETIRSATRILTGSDPNETMPLWRAPRIAPEKMERFQQSFTELLTTSLDAPELVGGPQARALEMECLRRLIDMLEASSTATRLPLGPQHRARLASRAVEYMQEHLEQPLSALDMCAEFDTSDRMLRRAFLEAFGLGPMAYFRVTRLHAARSSLKAARGRDESVAEIARRWGFHRLGSFASEYRRHFGELPSHTLGVRGWPGVQNETSGARRPRIVS